MIFNSLQNNQSSLYKQFIKPSLWELLHLLKMDITFIKAQGENLWYEKAPDTICKVYDFLGGHGSTILGHNHPQLLEELRSCIEELEPFHTQISVRDKIAKLGEKLNQLFQEKSGFEQSYYLHATNSGTEATEAAIKHALMEWQHKKKQFLYKVKAELIGRGEFDLQQFDSMTQNIEALTPVILSLEGAFHGKTTGSLVATFGENYRSMYPKEFLKSEFIKKNADDHELADIFSRYQITILSKYFFSRIIAIFVEPIQGEGGIHPISSKLIHSLKKHSNDYNIPLVFDEIQSGLYRTGSLLASEKYEVSPDYLLLGKSLSGGLTKIAGLLIAKDRYQEDFGIIHSSTFSEDNWSARIALRTLEILDEDAHIKDRANQFQSNLFLFVEKIQKKFPGIIKEVRGSGFFIGIEFDTQAFAKNSLLFSLLQESNLLTYLFSSYLLHVHYIRVAPTLNMSQTIRIEPSCYISDEAVNCLLAALEDLTQTLFEKKYAKIIQILFPDQRIESSKQNETQYSAPSYLKKITFLTHLVHKTDLKYLDPLLKYMPDHLIQTMIDSVGEKLESHNYYEQEIKGENGKSILLQLRGFALSSQFFERSLLKEDGKAFFKVKDAALRAQCVGASYLGLGQYTSIVTKNGLLLHDQGIPLTTGNALTIGMTYRAFLKMMVSKEKSTKELRVGIVGINGNICSVLAELVADDVKELLVVARKGTREQNRLEKTCQNILQRSTLLEENLYVTDDLDELKTCDCIILGTNSTQTFLKSQHLKEGAIVIDISVPSNIHPEIFEKRPDVMCIQGGLVKLPLNQKFHFKGLNTPNGEIFACMAETVLAGLLECKESLSLGPLSKKQVLEVLQMADSVGMELGSFKQIKAF